MQEANYTNPEQEGKGQKPQDLINASLIFARALGLILKNGEGIVVDVVVDVVIPAIFIVNVLVQTPVDVTNILVEVSLTLTSFPANNSALVAVLGVTVPPGVVRLKLGPKSAPNPESSVIVTFIYF